MLENGTALISTEGYVGCPVQLMNISSKDKKWAEIFLKIHTMNAHRQVIWQRLRNATSHNHIVTCMAGDQRQF